MTSSSASAAQLPVDSNEHKHDTIHSSAASTHSESCSPQGEDRPRPQGEETRLAGKVEHESSDEPADGKDILIVDWDGPDDPANPKNFPFRKRWYLTSLVSLYGFISPLSSSMIAPCIPHMSADLGVTESYKQNMMVSAYLIGYVVGPLIMGPISEVFGRRPVLAGGNLLFIAFTLGCSFAQTFEQMVACRILAGLGGGAPLAAGGGTLSDLWAPEERGMAASLYSLAPLLGPVIGPIAGGFIAQSISWRWAYWIQVLTAAVPCIVGGLLLQETYAPVLLEKKARKMRAQQQQQQQQQQHAVTVLPGADEDRKVEKDEHARKASLWSETTDAGAISANTSPRALERGSLGLARKISPTTIIKSKYDKGETLRQLLFRSQVRPMIMLTTQPIVMVVASYLAVLNGSFYIWLVTFTITFEETYGMSSGIASLNYLSLAIGFIVGRHVGSRLMDKFYKRLKAQNNGVGTPEMRLIILAGPAVLCPSGMLIFGWSIQYALHWIVPDIGALLFGMGVLCVTFVIQTYMMDTYALYAASAIAANTSLRSAAGFGFPLFATDMYRALGHGWGNSLLALVAFLLGGPGAFVLWKVGPKLRALSP